MGDRKCGAFLSRLDRDPHPTCTRCRGKVCTKDMTCDFCAVWSAEQWELFAKKRSYKERKQRPSGSVPPAQQTSPRAETSSGVSRPGTSASSSSRPSGGQEKGGGASRGAPGVVLGGAPSPPARPRSSERGGSASRHSSGASGLAPSSPSPSGGGGAGVARSLQTPLSRVSEAVDSPQFSPHVPRRENSRESSVSCSRILSSHHGFTPDAGSIFPTLPFSGWFAILEVLVMKCQGSRSPGLLRFSRSALGSGVLSSCHPSGGVSLVLRNMGGAR